MPKIPQCDRCQFYSHHYLVTCSLHPTGSESEDCVDFVPDAELASNRFEDFLGLEWADDSRLAQLSIDNPFTLDPEQNWSPGGTKFINGELVINMSDEDDESISYYNGEVIRQPRQRSLAEQLELLDTHPIFTGRCPNCEMAFPQNVRPLIHWDCQYCGWKDDSV